MVSWAFYDWANSSFSAIISTFVFAAYFTREVALNPTQGTELWGNVIGVAGFIVAIGGPFLGAMGDQVGRHKPWIALFTFICVVATAMMWFVKPSHVYIELALVLVGIATLTSEYATIFYNAMLPELAGRKYMGRWSGWGWGLGYVGGLVCLILALEAFVSHDPWISLNKSTAQDVRATFILVAVWYLVFSLPLFMFTSDTPSTGKSIRQGVKDGTIQLINSIRQVKRYRPIVRFLIARMIYIDGLATLFTFGGVYAAGSFNMAEQEVLMFGIALNASAGLGAIGFAWVDDFVGSKPTILISLVGLITTGTIILLVSSPLLFWIFGILLGIFVGPVQAASRSFLAHTAPENIRNQMFGLFALSGKATAFLGPLLVGWITFLTHSQRIGMGVIILFFFIGLVLMFTVPSVNETKNIIAKAK